MESTIMEGITLTGLKFTERETFYMMKILKLGKWQGRKCKNMKMYEQMTINTEKMYRYSHRPQMQQIPKCPHLDSFQLLQTIQCPEI